MDTGCGRPSFAKRQARKTARGNNSSAGAKDVAIQPGCELDGFD